jgi:hypothetical protein
MRKALMVLGLSGLFILSMVGTAFAAADTAAVSAVDGGAVILKDTLVSVATTVLPYAVAILAILLGWRMVRRFVKA